MVLTIHYNVIYGLATDARNACTQKAEFIEEPDFRESIAAVIFSAMTLESYINEAAYVARHLLKASQSGNYPPPWPDLERFTKRMIHMIRDKRNLEEKFAEAIYLTTGAEPDRGAAPFQNFVILIQVRNWITHTTSQIPPDLAKRLDERKLLRKPQPVPDGPSSVHDLRSIQTPSMAEWACLTTKMMIKHMARCAPTETPHLFGDLYNKTL